MTEVTFILDFKPLDLAYFRQQIA